MNCCVTTKCRFFLASGIHVIKAKTKAITNSTADADKAKTDNSKKLAELAESNIADMQNEKVKLQTLVQYTNVLSSYLGASKGDGEDREDTTLSYQRQIEFDNSKDTVGGDISKDEAEDFFGVSDQSSEQTNLQVDVDFIDSLLGNTSDEEDEKAKLNNN